MNNISTSNNWDTSLYEDKHAFVWQYGEDLLKLLNPQPRESILDLGCGTGQLTEKIAQAGAEVMGVDSAPAMIEKAKENYPHIRFDVADATNFQVKQPFDAVFSNAVLHWVKQADSAIGSIHQALKPGGRFVAEFGGRGNVKAITTALYSALESIGIPQAQVENPWYYPSIGEYSSLLEQQGFDVIYAILFPRPTPLAEGEAGIANWIKMFASPFLAGLSPEQQIQIISVVEEYLKPTLYQQGTWTADYRRIRIVAIKL
ncbi:class I SAM-dependent methyltransferase [Nostoc sp. 'Lobaria pulmonaria (5183) cyanobiont']|uniref:class I SAM-dependent methyltransferase n=1 Tax=Nostoc sp. 'Lobaria pulmonaria (5183) cyanobiont' TaxID=1618022 RepID=UPI000CF34044|nr:class I SAM-dependent methyltransferase [Nostoc sp. 'Lobaria pulmonaria (5183) cyanobiont']AVH69526.1 type 11 methyltransferase [Nostoc sp. 'Lobaria pulmonaria (5183) cyanobiont']